MSENLDKCYCRICQTSNLLGSFAMAFILPGILSLVIGMQEKMPRFAFFGFMMSISGVILMAITTIYTVRNSKKCESRDTPDA